MGREDLFHLRREVRGCTSQITASRRRTAFATSTLKGRGGSGTELTRRQEATAKPAVQAWAASAAPADGTDSPTRAASF